jgi:microcystin degradation protein MlrC
MRIAIGQLRHETNTMFGPPTPVEEFQRQSWAIGDEILAQNTGVRDYLGGMIDSGERHNVEIIPTFAANAHPSGTIERHAFETMLNNLLDGIRQAGEIDAVCVALHGAGSAEGIDDIEGETLARIRALVGTKIPIISTLDLHCHSTDTMMENATALLTVHEYPHVDSYERGWEAVELAVRIVTGTVHPVMHLTRLPMAIAPITSFDGPARAINERCWEWESRGLIDVTFVHGYPHTDVPIISASVIAIADGESDLARAAAEDVANLIWETRESFRQQLPEPASAIQQAQSHDGQPVVLAEVSDNPGGGAPGSGTHLLRAMLDTGLSKAAFGFIVDPATAAQAHDAGVGSEIEVELGGTIDPENLGTPIKARAYVKSLTDGRSITQSPMGYGGIQNLGKMARLIINGVDVIVGSESHQTFDAEPFLLHGIDVRRYKVIGLKSQNYFRAYFDQIASKIIRTDSPGWTPADLSRLRYQRIQRPIWPLDEDVTWKA